MSAKSVSPVRRLDAQALHDWMYINCWNRNPTGQCCDTAQFVELIFGWPAVIHTGHSWNVVPHSKQVLDLTVEQFGREHSKKLVHPDTAFDYGHTYKSKPQRRLNLRIFTTAIAWIKKLKQQVLDGHMSGSEFGVSRKNLLARLKHAIGEQ